MSISTYAAQSADLTSFKAQKMERYAPTKDDISFDVKYCGICHTDVHFVENELGFSQYPLVPGHELIGVVTAVGANVDGFKVGDHVGVGCMVDSCMDCRYCKRNDEQFCATGSTFTYGGVSTYGRCGPAGKPTIGGYSTAMVVHQHFAVKVAKEAPLDKAAPLMCAGVTMYEPLMMHKAGPGMAVGIAGCGGLGMMGIKLAVAMGADVYAISTTAAKKDECIKMGCKGFILSSDEAQMAAGAKTLDLILDTIGAAHDINAEGGLLATDGKIVLIGLQPAPMSYAVPNFLFSRHTITGSLIGGMKRTQEMMDFCVKNGIYPEVEVIKMDQIMPSLQTLKAKNDRLVRFVIDCSSITA